METVPASIPVDIPPEMHVDVSIISAAAIISTTPGNTTPGNIQATAGTCTGPWGPNPIDLSNAELTYDQKVWLANEHLIKKIPVSQLHTKYKIRSARLWFYIKGVKTATLYNGRNGRPLLLDKISILSVLEQLYENPTMETSNLRDVVRVAFRASVERKHSQKFDGGELQHRALPHTTVLRYCKKIQVSYLEFSYNPIWFETHPRF